MNPATGGVPPSPRGAWAAGIDIGGTKIAAGLLDPATGAVRARRRVPSEPERGGAAILNVVEALALELVAEAGTRGDSVIGIGVGVPEIVGLDGTVASAATIDWRTTPVRDRLGAVAPTTLIADVRAAALAEARFGAGSPFASFAYVSLGTGISSAMVIDGRPWPGARGSALVLASGPVSAPCPNCGSLAPFVLEGFASGPALARRFAEATGSAVAGAEAVIASAVEGDPIAVAIIGSAAVALGSAVAGLVNVFDPAAVVVGGGLGSAPGPLWSGLVEAIRRHVWLPAARSLPILQAKLGPDAGWVGAALAGERARLP